MRNRRSCRNFSSHPVEEPLITKLLYAGRRAPAAGNRSTRVFIVVRDPKILGMIQAVSPGYLGKSPLAVVICSDFSRGLDMAEWRRDFVAAYDCGCAAENIALAAVALGLGSCFVRAFSEIAVRTILKIPEQLRVQIIIAIGYSQPAETKAVKHRPEPIFLDRYGNNWHEGA